MKTSILILCVAAFSGAALAAPESPSPAELRMRQAAKSIERQPQKAEHHVASAMALARRARETADTDYYVQAHRSIDRALTLKPDDPEALRTRGWVLLGQHEFAQALALATSLSERNPEDLFTLALLVDANVELGRYAEAERVAQWLLDLRPGNIPGLTRAAYLRELFGDIEGSIQLMEQALQSTPHAETEDRAWLCTQLAHLHLAAGRVDVAEQLAAEALRLFPEYHYALQQMARVFEVRGLHREALAWQRRHFNAAPHPENRYVLARALDRAGLKKEARAAYLEFEREAERESAGWDNANRELVRYYADQAKRPRDALRVAEREIARRRDVHTLDAYAWALYRNGRHADARRIMSEALAVGTKDPELLAHAKRINRVKGDGRA